MGAKGQRLSRAMRTTDDSAQAKHAATSTMRERADEEERREIARRGS